MFKNTLKLCISYSLRSFLAHWAEFWLRNHNFWLDRATMTCLLKSHSLLHIGGTTLVYSKQNVLFLNKMIVNSCKNDDFKKVTFFEWTYDNISYFNYKTIDWTVNIVSIHARWRPNSKWKVLDFLILYFSASVFDKHSLKKP